MYRFLKVHTMNGKDLVLVGSVANHDTDFQQDMKYCHFEFCATDKVSLTESRP